MTEGPYKLPEGWRWVRLGDVAHREANLIAPRNYASKRFRYVGMEHLDAGQWDEPQGVEVDGSNIKGQVVSFRPGLVLYGKLRPYLNKVFVPSYEGIASTEFVPIAPRPDVLSPEYLGAYLRTTSFVGYATANTTGSRQPRTRLDALWTAMIPLPPLEEQRRIVARIEELMARVREARRLRERAKEEAERLWQSVLADTFPRPGSALPTGWRWARLEGVAKAVNGFGFPKRYQGRPSGAIAFLKVSDLSNPANEPEVTHAANYVDEQILSAIRGRAYLPGTIVFPKIGGAIATNKKRKLAIHAAFDNNIMGLVPDEDCVSSDYLLHWMYTVDLTHLSKIGPVPSIRQSAVDSQQVPLPPLAEQRRIVTHLEAVREKIGALRAVQAEIDAALTQLGKSILDKAFRGELLPTVSNEPSAWKVGGGV